VGPKTFIPQLISFSRAVYCDKSDQRTTLQPDSDLKERRRAKRNVPTIQRPFVDYLHNIHKSRLFHKFLSGQRTIQGETKLHASFQQ
jgi:hypothetical protein